MISRKDLLSIPFFKKSAFTGSCDGMRYRVRQIKAEDETSLLEAVIWPGPYIYDCTPDEQKESNTFPFNEGGIEQAAEWLDAKWKENPEKWQIHTKNYDTTVPYHPAHKAESDSEK